MFPYFQYSIQIFMKFVLLQFNNDNTFNNENVVNFRCCFDIKKLILCFSFFNIDIDL